MMNKVKVAKSKYTDGMILVVIICLKLQVYNDIIIYFHNDLVVYNNGSKLQ